ncbi:hypothetical protein EI555_011864, partial [Monodon monoceros]
VPRTLLPSSPGRTQFRRMWVGATPETEVSRGSADGNGLRSCSQSELKMNARGLGSQLKDSIPVTELSASGPFESHDLLRKGFSYVKNELLPSHPLELSEKNVQRLPFLPSSNLSLDILRGNDETIGFEDILN